MGIATVLLSVVVAWKFYSFQRNLKANASSLSNAISWQLVGEAIIGMGTLAFAGAAYYEVLPDWPQWLQSSIRAIMFFATSVTTYHLMCVLQRLEDLDR